MEVKETMHIEFELKNPDGSSRVETTLLRYNYISGKMRKMLLLMLTLMIWRTS